MLARFIHSDSELLIASAIYATKIDSCTMTLLRLRCINITMVLLFAVNKFLIHVHVLNIHT